MSKVLVTYFSAGGTTAKVGIKLAKAIEADVYQILPKVPYRAGDLNWMNKKSRSSVEMSDRNCRPEMANKLSNMEDYDVIFLGFPIWWYREPSIIDTFMEAYDFKGKTVVVFCTSGGSELGEAPKNIQNLAPKAKVVEGERFKRGVKEAALKEWASKWI